MVEANIQKDINGNMKIELVKTQIGLKPLTDSDLDKIKKIELGEIVEIVVKKTRSYRFLKKYMALINLMWGNDSLNLTRERYRKEMEIAAGYFDTYKGYDGDVRREPKSISFEKMQEDEFENLFQDMLQLACLRLGVDSGEISNELKETLGKFY